MPRKKKSEHQNTEEIVKDDPTSAMYSEYVHGTPISEIAVKYDKETHEVLGAIKTVEQNR